jgi:hypothetical protein
MLKRGPLRIVLMFVLAAILFGLSVLLIVSTWWTGLGRVIVFIMGIILIVIGVVIMVGAISDLFKALKS